MAEAKRWILACEAIMSGDDVSEFDQMTCNIMLMLLEELPSYINQPRVRKLISQARQIIIKSGVYDSGKFNEWLKTQSGKRWADRCGLNES